MILDLVDVLGHLGDFFLTMQNTFTPATSLNTAWFKSEGAHFSKSKIILSS